MFRRAPSYPRKGCSFCKTMRVVVAMAILVLALASLSFDFGLLADIHFTDLFAALIAAALLVVMAWKAWDEHLRERFNNRKKGS